MLKTYEVNKIWKDYKGSPSCIGSHVGPTCHSLRLITFQLTFKRPYVTSYLNYVLVKYIRNLLSSQLTDLLNVDIVHSLQLRLSTLITVLYLINGFLLIINNLIVLYSHKIPAWLLCAHDECIWTFRVMSLAALHMIIFVV